MARAPHLSRWLWTAAAVVGCTAVFGVAGLVAGRAASTPDRGSVSVGTAASGATTTTPLDASSEPVVDESPATTVAPTKPLGTKVAIVGDSLTEGIRSRLPALASREGFDAKIDSQSGREIEAGISPLKKIVAGRDLVVVALGTNDARSGLRAEEATARIQEMLDVAGTTTPVLWVNVYRADTKDTAAAAQRFNAALDAMARTRPNLTVLDWSSYLRGRGNLVGPDGIHLTDLGYDERAAWLARAIAGALRLPEPAAPSNAR